ncbi:beta-1,6-N-acetylglucosaminyltransferase [Ideonella sp.]|uniref:beta-1,6-N-acetylglucosaminyltransferase n=1 Tax=Ideonella sp. TaxID=1929293 RepID=UPI0035B20EB8
MKIAVLMLCHEAPARLAPRLASPFYRSDDVRLYIHYDARRGADELGQLERLVPEGVAARLLPDRVACGWGDYSLVEATHRLMKAALADDGFAADYLVLVSGSCTPVRPLASLQAYLRRRRGMDFIQAVDVQHRSWVKGGLEQERYQYWFPFNFRTHRAWFERTTRWQRRLGIRRAMPEGLRIHFGSQWFALTRETARRVAARLDEPALRGFFARSWIPDEFALQTLVAAEQRPALIAGHHLTYYEFDGQGRPLVLDNGHAGHLARQPFFFARKVAPQAVALQRQIDERVAGVEQDFSYFNHVGRPTNDYQRFLAHALTVKAARATVGSSQDAWRGFMDFNRRPYYVLHASSRSYLLALLAAAREAAPGLPLLDFVFDPASLVPASGQGPVRGVQAGMRARRDYDPGAFLYELANLDSRWPTAFALDAGVPSWTREFVLWDSNATLVHCDPPGLGKLQRAEAALRALNAATDGPVFAATLEAALSPKWLPQEHFAAAVAEKQPACQSWTLADLARERPTDPVLAALASAASRVDAARHHLGSEALARDALGASRHLAD